MKIVENSIRFSVTTAVGVILVVLFGAIALYRIPVQLIPTVEKPEIRVQTAWPGALPQEVERQIIQEQEEQLKSVQGLERMDSTSSSGEGTIQMTFQIGTDVDRALLDVSNRLQQVERYPETALRPQVRAASEEADSIAFFVILHKDPENAERPISEYRDFVEDIVAPEIERVPGVSAADILGGVRHEMHFLADPEKLAARKITISQVATAIDRENANVSGGDFDEGKVNYLVRTESEYSSPEEVENVVISHQDGVPIFARDVGYARLGFEKKRGQGFVNGLETQAMRVSKSPGANLIEVMDGIHAAADRLNRQILEPRGIEMIQMFDATDYIDSSMELLQQSLAVGAGLAVFVLLLFLRSGSSTLVIALAMPISVIGTFLVMDLTGRTLNVVSLAGLAFAVGMVVDNSIVALENIYRHRQMGKTRQRAANDGASEVWGAILASTLTTVAVFLPVIFIEEEAGQLFRDIAIAISGAVVLSMIVAITVIPALSAKMLGTAAGGRLKRAFANLFGLANLASGFAGRIADFVHWICRSTVRRLALTGALTAAAILGAVQMIPDVEYLPTGNANFIFGRVNLPSSYSLEESERLRHVYFNEARPYMDCEATDLECPGGGFKHAFVVAFGNFMFAGGRANDPLRIEELVPVLRSATEKIPAAVGGFRPSNLFQRGRDAGFIDLDILGPDFERLQEIGRIVLARVQQEIPEAQAQPLTGIDPGKPELRIIPHRVKTAELGVTSADLGLALDALVDGTKVSEYQWQGKRIDLKLIAELGRRHRTHEIHELPIAVPGGRLVTIDSLADVKLTTSPVEISHRERQRATTIRLTPPPGVPLQTTLRNIEERVIQPLAEEEVLTGMYRIIPSGTADKLGAAWEALRLNLGLAVVITYLLMAALFQSFAYPFVILLSVPLAGFGGLLGLRAINLLSYQPLDILTMLGFFILVGTVVNNAILLVHQSLNHMRYDGMEALDAIRESTRNRIRPIFMSVLTSVCGMTPLVLFPGAGSELYRGIGSVVIGGLLTSTIFTLAMVPAMFSLFMDFREALARFVSRVTGFGHEAEPG